jgi:hypothetical protein
MWKPWPAKTETNMKSSSKATAAFLFFVSVLLSSLPTYGASFTFNFDSNFQFIAPGNSYTFTGTLDNDEALNLTKWYLDPTISMPAGISATQPSGMPGSIPPSYAGPLLTISVASGVPIGTALAGDLYIGGTYQSGGGALQWQTFGITVVPEPYQYGMIAVFGLLGIGGYHRFSRKEA